MRSFLGMAPYSVKFIDNFAVITELLRALTEQDSEWHWTKEQEDAFECIKSCTLREHNTCILRSPKAHRNSC